MNRQEKFELIESLKDSLQNSQASFLVEYKGLDVASLMSLRKKLREHGGSFKVAKVTLVRRAIQEFPEFSGLDTFLHDQVALVFSQNEPPAVAKVLYNFAKEHKSLHIKGGCFEEQILSVDAVQELATLPSREELLAHVCGTIQAPTAQLVYALQSLMVQLAWVIEEAGKKKSA